MGAEAAAFNDLADREVSTSSHEQTESEEATEKAEGLEEVESHQSEHDGESPGDDRSGDNAKLEKGPPLNHRDPHLVTWQGTNDPENPKNWPQKKKWAAVIVVSSFTFISPLASTLVAPALPQIARDLNIHGTTLENMVLSIFILAYAIGPMILGPLSEVFGRVPVLQLANVFFIIFNLVCGFAQTIPEILVFRFLAGLGGSAPLGVGGGVLADLFPPEQRGKAIAIYSVAPLLGPALGPVVGGFIAEYSTWRWAFWAVSITCVPIQISGLFFLQETWAPKLLAKKVKKLRKETGNELLHAELVVESLFHKIEHSLVRPFKLLSTQPIIMVMSLYMAYLYGLVYLVITSFSTLYTSPKYYHESVGISGLHYIALGLGYFVGAQVSARANDWMYRRLKARNNGVGRPEFRVPMLIPCAVLLPIGLLWYGWSAQGRVFWLMPDIGAGILAAATITGYQGIQSYVIDSYTKYAASAIAAISFIRSIAGFGFPLFAPALYNGLGYGFGNTVLAGVAIVIGVPAPWIFWRYGERLRARSQYAAGGG
ncbi:major facilitator superfamily domain-containing protein [Neohortaea acidophila]|uniref:Cercosporin MFS transporter CTB4 n=1 Tax=Neohortaea acidophila TaxID=245834 RepID=A0A6A6PPL1_9PEZI|nr:major facilitator superfamily domain-containing protein [Neohortaea acidophila]KAF2481736.1 major facilitator superfamily domain-containing protein [Neohortaea acidophila]